MEVLKQLKCWIQRIGPDVADNWKLQHNNAPAHSAFIVTDYLVKAGMPTIPQSRYSPHLAHPDFFLCLSLKTHEKGENFETVHGIKAACTTAIKAIPEEAYRNTFESWKPCWSRCIDAKGDYFEDFYTLVTINSINVF